MAESQAGPSPEAETDAPVETTGWGRALDAAGIAAGVLLVLIAVDIWTDGRLISRRLHRGGGEPVEPAE
jgi:hypothetical protein